jgi:hypothetical protein
MTTLTLNQLSQGHSSISRDPTATRRLARASALAETPLRSRRRHTGGYDWPQYDRRLFGFMTN